MALDSSRWFPPEIIREILLKLHVESLLRCKSVCKQWYSLISDQNFIKTHYNLSNTNINFAHLVFIFPSCSRTSKLKSCPLNDVLLDNSVNNAIDCFTYRYNRTPYYPTIQIVGSCNGLLCIISEGKICVYNPSTRILHRLDRRLISRGFQGFGFGYDELNDDYKVVEVEFDRIYIYSLKTRKWKNICYFPNKYRSKVPGIFSNGALHWAENNPTLGTSNKWKIHSLDLAKETYHEVLQPEYDEGVMWLELGALRQSLCVLCNYCKTHADLWVLKAYGVKDSWTKLASIPFDPLRDHFLNNNSCLKFSDPLCISNDGKVLLRFCGKYFVFDTKNIAFTLVTEEIIANAQPCTFVESLVPPNYALGICNSLRSSRKRLRSSWASS